LRTRTALREPRDAEAADDDGDLAERAARGGDPPAGRRATGGGSGLRQIGQFSTKRL
jgi:hypothetical protein